MAPPLPLDNPMVPPVSLRDLIALVAVTRLDPESAGSASAFAKDCYDLADALLAYRPGGAA